MDNSPKKRRRSYLPIVLILLAVFVLMWFAAARVEKMLAARAAQELAAQQAAAQEQARLQAEQEAEQQQDHSYLKFPDVPLNTYDRDAYYKVGPFRYYMLQDCQAGIDVSSHVGTIDWPTVKAAGADFALIRIGYRGYTEGQIQSDVCFQEYYSGCRDAGLSAGVYFFSQAVNEAEAEEEAQFVLDALNGAPLDYPVFFDWEPIEDKARTDAMDDDTLNACVLAFCKRIEEGGYRAGVYFNQTYGYEKLDLSALKDYTFWLADYEIPSGFTYDFAIWQYSDCGTVDGIDLPVDLDLAFIKE